MVKRCFRGLQEVSRACQGHFKTLQRVLGAFRGVLGGFRDASVFREIMEVQKCFRRSQGVSNRFKARFRRVSKVSSVLGPYGLGRYDTEPFQGHLSFQRLEFQ